MTNNGQYGTAKRDAYHFFCDSRRALTMRESAQSFQLGYIERYGHPEQQTDLVSKID